MKIFFKTIITLIVLVVAGIGTFFIAQAIQEELSAEDSSALYGGRLEYGYPQAGFILAFDQNWSLSLCGYTVLNQNVGITASHCIDNARAMYLGRGQFTPDPTGLIEVSRAVQKDGWVSNRIRSDDFAVLNFNDNFNYFDAFSEVASPVEGCHYRVVAYGLTENPNDNVPRKSARLCTVKIDDKTMWVRGFDSGICFGDSGSPVFYNNTNKVVGVIASIIHENPEDAAEPCSFNNTAIVVRADKNSELINENIRSANAGLDQIDVIDGLTVEVTDPSVLSRLGLGRLEGLSQEDRTTFTLIGGIVFVMILMIGAMLSLLTGKKR